MRTRSYHLGILLLALLPVTATAQVSDRNDALLRMLRELKPLQKVHYSWPIPDSRLTALDPFLYEYARITHAVSLRVETATRQQIDAAVAVCARINRNNPEIPASIGLHYSPWHRIFSKDMPPTQRGQKHIAEMRQMKDKFRSVLDRIAFANRLDRADVQVTAVILDCERFVVKPGNAEWNEAILRKHEEAADAIGLMLPNARLEWYARGAMHPGATPSGWTPNRNFTLKEPGQAFACSLYRLPEIELNRETYRRTVQHAKQRGVEEVTPWVALASGYRRTPSSFQKFSFDWNYDLVYSWQLGAEINNSWYGRKEQQVRYAEWDRAKIAIFYPEPFGRSPHWGKHFVAYVRGAQRDERLP